MIAASAKPKANLDALCMALLTFAYLHRHESKDDWMKRPTFSVTAETYPYLQTKKDYRLVLESGTSAEF